MNNISLPASTDYYQQQNTSPTMPFGFSGFSDATTVATSLTCDTQLSSSSVNPSAKTGAIADLKPKGNIGKTVSKQSRISRRAPTILVNASTSNFRALVQQYTGFRKSTYSRARRGPITLSFGGDNIASDSFSEQDDHITIFPSASNNSDHNYVQSWQQLRELWRPHDQQQQHHGNSMDVIAKANDFTLLNHDHFMDDISF